VTTTPGVSVVVPVYNGGALLDELLRALREALRDVGPHEVIVVDDGSEDETWATVERLADRHAEVRALRLMRNYGQHNALLAGIRAARHDVTVTIDADLQYPPAVIPELVARLGEGYDVVYGTAGRRTEGLVRRLAARVARRVLRSVMGVDVTFSSFRAFSTRLRDGFAEFRGPYVSIDVLLSWSTVRFASVPVTQEPRREGRSSYSAGKLATLALTMLTGFSTRPLRLASLVGFAFTLLGLVLLGYVVVRYFVSGRVVPGFPFLASVISIFAGAQLFALGIIGEYLARVHMRVLDPPTYAIREELR
jgi:undecaprenyl-phosphate 4-deoxy-4-formamido-L-arabinose transferase